MQLAERPAPPPAAGLDQPPATPTSYTANLPAVIAPRRHARWRPWLGAGLAAVLLAAAAAFVFREDLTRLPAEWRALVGQATPPRPAPQPRLELDMASSAVELADGRYVVRGQLVNAGTAPGSTSALKLVFRNGEDVLGERTYPLVEGPIEPGQRLSFSRPFDDPPEGTTNVVPSVE